MESIVGGSWSKRGVVVLFACLGLFTLAGVATAGQAAASATIIGQVTDESGAILPGVSVSAKSPALQVPSVVSVTDEHGEYRLTPLPIGVYTVDYELQGFQGVRHEDIRLTVGFVAKIDVQLKIGSLAETITVAGAAPVVDVTSTTTMSRFTETELELTPTSRNSIIGLLALAPGVRSNLDVGGSTLTTVPSFRAYGQSNEAYNTIEGVLTTALKGTGGNGNYWDYASVEESQVKTIGADADVPTRGVQLSAVVKSGGNQFHGSGHWGQTNSHFQSNNIDDALTAQGITRGNPLKTRWDGSAEIGGRLVRDRLWFYVSTRQRKDLTEILGGVTDTGEPALSDQRQKLVTSKVTSQLNASNRLIGFYQRNHKYDEALDSPFALWESRRLLEPISRQAKVEWQIVMGNSLVASLQQGWWKHKDGPKPTFSTGISTLDRGTQVLTGEYTASGELSSNRRHHTKGQLTWYKPDVLAGNHEIKSGFDFMANEGFERHGSRESTNYRLIFNNGAPLQIETYNFPIVPTEISRYLSMYVTDSWTIQRRLTLNLGLRYAHDNGYSPGACRPAADPPAHILFPASCYDKIQFKVWNPISPRVHVAYDVTGNGKNVVKGGWGRFNHQRQLYTEIDQSDPQVTSTAVYRWRDLNTNRNYDAGEVNLDPNGPDFVSVSGGSNQIPNPNEKEPGSDEFSVSFERELMPNFALRTTGIYSRNFDIYRLTNLFRPYSSYSNPVNVKDPGPDGRLGTVDDTGNTITYYEYPASLSGRAYERFTLTNDSDANPSFKTLELSAFKRLSQGWMASGSFAATKSSNPLGSLNVYGPADNPNGEIFAENNTWEWITKVSGAYFFPGQVMASANFENRSGDVFARTAVFTGGVLSSITLPVESIGSIRLPAINLLDLRVSKTIGRGAQNLKLSANLYNALNVNTATAVNRQSGASFMRTTAIVGSRILEFVADYSF